MKISLHWLKDYVHVALPPEKLAHRLTMSGLEVEKIEHVDGDVVLEMEITPNRPDCLNVLGVARELSAVLNKRLKFPRKRKLASPKKSCDISILDKEGCPRYIGTLIKGVAVKSAPERMAQKLKAIGLRPINNIVDITNFCLFENGQPMHAFDYDKLIDGKIIVRRARAGEKIVTIDGVERSLDPSILVIADAKRSVAIAGIMGGKETEVTAETKNILLESAYFNPVLIRRAARKLGLSSDSSYRFERGVDLPGVETTVARALQLILDEAGGTIVARSDIFPQKRKISPRQVTVSKTQIDSLLGANLTVSRCKTILKQLGFKVNAENSQSLKVVSPSFRNDIKQPVDLIEEIARVVGYDHLPMTVPQIKISSVTQNNRWAAKNVLRQALQARGHNEVISYSMVSRDDLTKTKLPEVLRVKNPLSQEQEFMRPSLLPGMLRAVQFNFNRGQKDLKLYELGKRYSATGETDLVGVVLTGQVYEDWRVVKKGEADFFDLKGAVSAVFQALGFEKEMEIQKKDFPLFSTGLGAAIVVHGRVCGCLGPVHREVARNFDIKHEDVFFAEIEFGSFAEEKRPRHRYQPVFGYPAVTRDVSLAINLGISFADIQKTIQESDESILSSVIFREEYLGEKIPAGKRGIVFSLMYQSAERTLTEDEVAKAHEKIVRAIVEKNGATVR